MTQTDLDSLATSAGRPIAGMRLKDRVAIVSGAGRGEGLLGVGAATAALFAAQGATVGVLDYDRARAEATLSLIEAIGGRGLIVEADIREAESCRAAVRQVTDACERLDIVVNSAAIARAGGVESVSAQDWRDVLDVSLTGAMQLTQAASAPLSVQGGAIINISSVGGSRGFGAAAYASAKGGLEALTRDEAVSLGRQGVRANCLVVGFIHAPMAGGGEAAREVRRNASPLGTEGTAWDVAFAALFLASDEARWISGVCLPVDAGLSIAGPLRFS
jgi:NAD(P)-dependent dehydrogenase (short-subunit alcohol dehydrogenase family)